MYPVVQLSTPLHCGYRCLDTQQRLLDPELGEWKAQIENQKAYIGQCSSGYPRAPITSLESDSERQCCQPYLCDAKNALVRHLTCCTARKLSPSTAVPEMELLCYLKWTTGYGL